MKSFYWNIRGLANTPSRLVLKKLIKDNKPDFIAIAEPWMVYESFPRNWFNRLGYKLVSVNTRDDIIPNLWCFCKIEHNPTVISVDDQQISFTLTQNEKTFAISSIYASTSHLKRRQLWQNLTMLQANFDIPWCYIGDFNTILGAHEHSGSFIPARVPMEDFQQWTNQNDLLHIPTRGSFFPWNNGRRGRRHTQRRLDRAICNQHWLNWCTSISCSTLVKDRSDHHPILLDFNSHSNCFAGSFKFMRMWAMHSDCKNVVAASWSERVVGCPMFILSQKLKNLKAKLKLWNINVFGNVQVAVKNAERNLLHIQNQIHTDGHNDDLLNQEKSAQVALDDALARDECFWKEKARVQWHLEGDRNTAYFHRVTKIKNTTKLISSIRIGENHITESSQISDHIVNYFKNLFSANLLLQDQSLIDEVIPSLIDEPVNNMLTMMPSFLEIRNAVFDLNKDGAPGPDGFGAFFFQTYWEIIKHDVVNAVLEFFTSGWLLPNFNANTLILIPKHQNADSVEQYRPIALANFKFKIISKIIADRLAQILPSIISKEQRGFIKGRNIRDCIGLASEAINLLDKKVFGGNLALKIDISKTFDTLDWNFLLKVLSSFGFNQVFCNWIKVILKSATISISINGSQHGYFNCHRGVRQGDPLSPLLFCIAEEVLSRGISKLVDDHKIDLIGSSRGACIPSHCLYADDIMVYCRGKTSNLQALKALFTDYANCSGQFISAPKSTIYSGGITQSRLNLIAQMLGFSIGSLPFTYLGVPIFKGKPKARYLQPIADRIKVKLSAWRASLLSIAGRVQLVRSVVQGMMIHSISIYSWPISLLKDLERCIKNFIWSGEINKRKLITVAWKKVCKPLNEGGLGIRSLITLNEATNLKLCWDLLHSNEAWAQLLRKRVFRETRAINHHIFSSL